MSKYTIPITIYRYSPYIGLYSDWRFGIFLVVETRIHVKCIGSYYIKPITQLLPHFTENLKCCWIIKYVVFYIFLHIFYLISNKKTTDWSLRIAYIYPRVYYITLANLTLSFFFRIVFNCILYACMACVLVIFKNLIKNAVSNHHLILETR